MNETKVFSRIPMRTWRWLGVNEVMMPPNISGEIKWHRVTVEAGSSNEVVLPLREGGQHEVIATVGVGAKLHLVLVQLVALSTPVAVRVKVEVAMDGHFAYTGAELGGSEALSELNVELMGDGSTADVWSLYFGDGKRLVDLNYIIRQKGRRTESNMQVRGVLLGKATKNFRGTLDFLEGSKGSVGREDEEVVLLSDTVRNRSVPIMLSHEDDVDGHHAVSIGKMDEGKLFYLMSRGLNLEEARRLVIDASFNPVLDRLSDPALRDEINQQIEGRLQNV